MNDLPLCHRCKMCIRDRAKVNGYVSTLMGRLRWLPELKSSNHKLRSFCERVALNMPSQGTAADIIKQAMLAVYRRLSAEHMEGRLILQVHDELIVELSLIHIYGKNGHCATMPFPHWLSRRGC